MPGTRDFNFFSLVARLLKFPDTNGVCRLGVLAQQKPNRKPPTFRNVGVELVLEGFERYFSAEISIACNSESGLEFFMRKSDLLSHFVHFRFI